MEDIEPRKCRIVNVNLSDFVSNAVKNEITRVCKTSSRIAILGSIRIHAQAVVYAREGMDAHLEAMFTNGFHSDSYFRELYTVPDSPFAQLALQMGLNETNTGILGKGIDVNFKNNVTQNHQR